MAVKHVLMEVYVVFFEGVQKKYIRQSNVCILLLIFNISKIVWERASSRRVTKPWTKHVEEQEVTNYGMEAAT